MLHRASGGVGNTYVYSSKTSNSNIVNKGYNSIWNTARQQLGRV